MTPRLTIGITTKNRPDALAACLASLEILRGLDPEVIVFDDGSNPPAQTTAAPGGLRVRVIRDEACPGLHRRTQPHGARGRRARRAAARRRHPHPHARQRRAALAVLDGDSRVAAVAFAQAEADGRPWQAGDAAVAGRLSVHRPQLHRVRAPRCAARRSSRSAAIAKSSSTTAKRRISACGSSTPGTTRSICRTPAWRTFRRPRPEPDALSAVRRPQRLPECALQRSVSAAALDAAGALFPVFQDAARLADPRPVGLGLARAPAGWPDRASRRGAGVRCRERRFAPGAA